MRKTLGTVAVKYTYNVRNRLIRVEDEQSGVVIADYGYDPFGRRLWKEVDGTRTYFLYSDEGLVAEYDEQGNELRSCGWQPDSTWGTHPLWLKQNGTYYWYQNDHLGTPQKLIDKNGTVVWEAQYSAFGEAQIAVETITNNLRFPGQYYDAETGLHYNWNRYYDPVTGRYTQVDPIGFAGGLNLYGYVTNNPLIFGDAKGLLCGSGWTDNVVPDIPSGDFRECCQVHDDCYGGEHNQCWKRKDQCDIEFFICMIAKCATPITLTPEDKPYYGGWYYEDGERYQLPSYGKPIVIIPPVSKCLEIARLYYDAVNRLGDNAYKAARSRVGSQRVTLRHFSNCPPPNRTCQFLSIRLSRKFEV